MQYLRDIIVLRACLVSPLPWTPGDLREAFFGDRGFLKALMQLSGRRFRWRIAFCILWQGL
eukprot:13807453-Alexandrium_andersonii.AAC.1